MVIQDMQVCHMHNDAHGMLWVLSSIYFHTSLYPDNMIAISVLRRAIQFLVLLYSSLELVYELATSSCTNYCVKKYSQYHLDVTISLF